MMTGRSKNASDEAGHAIKQTQALHLRAHGHTYRSIAKTLGCSVALAYKLVDEAIAEERAACRSAKANLVEMEINRCDMYLTSIAKKVQAGDVRAIDTAIRIADRRSKLLGLDSPEKRQIEHSGEIHSRPPVDPAAALNAAKQAEEAGEV